MSRPFLICPEPVGRLTAGVGTRFLTLAQVLAAGGHEVTLAIPNDPAAAQPVAAGFRLVQADPATIGAQAEGHDWVLIHAHLGNHYLSQRDDLPLVVDLYDPFLIENLHYHHDLGFAPFETDHATWHRQMMRGDFFLCSSEEQRLFYLGWLSALGRVNPLVLEDDPTLRRLIVELPFGTPEMDLPPRPRRAEVIEGVEEDAPLLYFGGIYDWYDPEVLLEALPSLLARDPRTTVVFVEHPHPDLTPLQTAARARRIAEQQGWLGTAVRFEEWRSHEQRFDLPLVSDLAVVTHRPGLETDLSLRTRLVDLMWLGLPMVVSAGGTMARVIQERGAGEVVPPGDSNALTLAVEGLLADEEGRRRAGEAARSWAAGRSSSQVAEPLLDFAAAPRRDPHRARFTELAPEAQTAQEEFTRRLRRALWRLWGGR